MTDREPARQSGLFTLERLSAVSDGVIAIALTLLILEVKLPDLPEGYAERLLISDLEGQLPEVLAWIVSFVLIARFWQEHHNISAHLRHCDHTTIVLAFVFLGSCTFIPFAADLVSHYHKEPLAGDIFSVIALANGLSLAALAAHAARNPQLHGERGPGVLRRRAAYLAVATPAVAAVAVLAAHFGHALLGASMWLLEPLAMALLTGRWLYWH